MEGTEREQPLGRPHLTPSCPNSSLKFPTTGASHLLYSTPLPNVLCQGQAPAGGEKPLLPDRPPQPLGRQATSCSPVPMPMDALFSLLPPSKSMKDRKAEALGLCKSLCSWKRILVCRQLRQRSHVISSFADKLGGFEDLVLQTSISHAGGLGSLTPKSQSF